MRALQITRRAFARNPAAMQGDVADELRAQLFISRAQAYRLVRQAMDVLCLHYEPVAHIVRAADKSADRTQENRSYRRAEESAHG